MARLNAGQQRRNLGLWVWFAYVVFVIYGSLVPLDYQPIPLGQAWAAFQQIHLLDVGAGGRADWVANGVLYVPVGFLTAMLLRRHWAGVSALAVVGALVFSASLAVIVEFAQLAFPPRTVSLNDILAEWIGSGLGVILAMLAGQRFRILLASLVSRVDDLAPSLLKLYALGYCAFSLFPYDFVLSTGELAEKFQSDHWGWLWAGGDGRGGAAAAVAKIGAEALAAMPLGLLLARRGAAPGTALVAGGVLGAVIEFAQMFLISGVSQGLSVVTRALGLWAGALVWGRRGSIDPSYVAGRIRRFGLPLVGLYLLALAAVAGWFELPWHGVDAAREALTQVRFLPFYYHYYTSEAVAVVSLVVTVLTYFPLGVLAWGLGGRPGLAAGLGVVVGAVMEVSKLFLVGQHPDPTNVLLAGLAAWVGCRLAGGLAALATDGLRSSPGAGLVEGEAPRSPPAVAQFHGPAEVATERGPESGPALERKAQFREANGSSSSRRGRSGGLSGDGAGGASGGATPTAGLANPGALGFLGLLLAVGGLGWALAGFPVHPVLLGLGLGACAVLLWFRPRYLWIMVPAALPLLDLAAWSGRFFLDEFDFLLLICVAVGYARLPRPGRARDGVWLGVLFLLAASVAIAMVRGVLPWQMPDGNAFNNYYSPFNALRIGKGALWALLLLGLVGPSMRAGINVRRLFGFGMVVGLAGTVAVILWERLTFSGLFNFDSDYRVTGPFSAIHTGGAYIECFLAAAVPFLVLQLLERRSWLLRVAGIGLLLATTYALMVTFSRNGYSAYVVAIGVVFLFAMKSGPLRVNRFVLLALLACAVVGTAAPILLGGFAQQRIAQIGADLGIRQAHWAETLGMRDEGLGTALFGMGLGRFPETSFWRSREKNRPGSYRLETENGDTFLRLSPGESIYVDQFVTVTPYTEYVLRVDLRARAAHANFTFPLCQKWLLTSFNCAWKTVDVGDQPDTWVHHEVRLNSGALGDGHWYARRSVKLSLYNPNSATTVDVDNVSLAPLGGENLVSNGDFGEGLDYWFFATDSHLQWHAKSLPVAVLFDQGWLGIVAWSLFLAVALGRPVARAWGGDLLAGAVVASVLAILVVGLFDTVIDAPRFLLLLILLGGIGAWGRRGPAG